MKRLVPLILASAGCVTTAPSPPKLLPQGVYHHDVSLEMDGKDPQRFTGLLKIDGERMTMVMLSPFGTTMARITDALHEVDDKLIVYADEIKPYQDRMTTIYRALKPAFIDANANEVSVYGRTLRVAHEGKTPPGVPKTTVITGEGIRMAVEVTGYEDARR